MSKPIDLTKYIGQKFNEWLVIGVGEPKIYDCGTIIRKLKCKCTCGFCDGVIKDVDIKNLRNNKSKSCGKKIKTERCIELSKKNKKYNNYNLDKEYGIGYTSNNNKKFYFDLEDYDKIKDYTWFMDTNGYILTVVTIGYKRRNNIYLHNLIMDCDIRNVDHINREKHDNRKNNLRIFEITSQNVSNISIKKNNTSGITGVSWNKQRCMWQAYIQYKHVSYNLGFYDNKEDAIKIRLKYESKLMKEFAPQRDLFERYGIKLKGE